MSNAENAKLQYEGGQTVTAMSALTNGGDNKTFSGGAGLWSRRSGYEPVVRPSGLSTGGAVAVAASASNNVIDVAALTAFVAGLSLAVAAATDVALTRGSTDGYIINSITVTSAGAIVVVAGTESTAHSETRGAAGGPPYIPTTSIEVAQVRLTSITAAPVAASEIFQTVGVHQERYDYPLYSIDYVNGEVVFNAALPTIHTGDVPKAVHASYAEPIFADAPKTSDFVPSETTHSVASKQIYGTTLGSTSSTLNQASFNAYLEDGVNDSLVKLKNETLWFKFFPNQYKGDYILEQGKLGISRTFPAGDEIQASCTISVTSAGVEVAA